MPTAPVNGTHLHYELRGSEGPPVLLIMGMRSRGLGWTRVAEDLARDHRVVFYDHRGIGESAPLEQPTSMGEMAQDALALADHLGWKRPHVAGVSMGGMVAQNLAVDHPDSLRTLSLVATTANGPSVQRPSKGTAMIYVRTQIGSVKARLRALAELIYSQAYRSGRDHDELLAELSRAFGHVQKGTWRAQFRAMAGHDTRERLREVGVPSLVVGAGLDKLVPMRHAEDLHDRLPGSTFERFESAGHGVIAEEPAAVAQAIRSRVATS